MAETDVFMENPTGSVPTIAELGALSTKPRMLHPATDYAVPDGAGSVKVIRTDDPALHPRFIGAARTVGDATSFINYVTRHAGAHTEVYADLARASIVAVIDSHDAASNEGATRPGHEKHKVTLVLEKTPSWQAWAKLDNKLVSQEQFAEHIEENFVDVTRPEAADLLELAQTFHATRGVEFGQSTRLSSGETQIQYAEKLDGKAGRSGEIAIPDEIGLALVPFVGSTVAYSIVAKFRWRLNQAQLGLGYKLIRPERILEDAFNDILKEITAGVPEGVPVFHGRP